MQPQKQLEHPNNFNQAADTVYALQRPRNNSNTQTLTIMPAIKICGINDAVFARRAEALGADYLGFIFAEGSPRRVTPAQASGIAAALSGKAKKVGVFTATSAHEILEIAKSVPLDVVQLHSLDYGADEIQKLKANGLEVWRLHEPCGADAVLLDGAAGGRCGGTGQLADWRRATELAASGVRVVLAGGISAENAAAAAATGCAVLDVNSSLETAPGVKSIERLEAFMSAVRSG